MDPNKPGLSETEELGENSSVEAASQPNAVEASDSAEETSPADITQSVAESDVQTDTETASSAAEDAESSAAQAQETPAEVEEPATEAAAPAEVEAPAVETAAPASEAAPALKRGDLIEGTIVATSPTSITVDVGDGIEGIVPSHELERMSRPMIEGLMPGEKLAVFVVNPHDHTGNVILSVNRALEEMDWQRAEQYRQSQDVYETRVAGYNKGGLIVRFGRLRGFVPQSQMSADRRRETAGDTPEDRWGGMVNQPIVVKVMEVDRSRNRLILSERSAARESREKRKEALIGQLKVGEVRTGRVVSLEDFGVFVDVGGAEGLVHLTELSWQHVTHPREMLEVGQEVKVEVISIDPDAKRIGLSMRRQSPDPWDTVAIDYGVGQLVQAVVTKLTKFGAFAQLVDVPEIEGLIHISELSDKRVNHPREVVAEGDKLTLRVVKMDIKNRRLGLSLKRVNSAEYLDLDWTSGGGDGEPPSDE